MGLRRSQALLKAPNLAKRGKPWLQKAAEKHPTQTSLPMSSHHSLQESRIKQEHDRSGLRPDVLPQDLVEETDAAFLSGEMQSLEARRMHPPLDRRRGSANLLKRQVSSFSWPSPQIASRWVGRGGRWPPRGIRVYSWKSQYILSGSLACGRARKSQKCPGLILKVIFGKKE